MYCAAYHSFLFPMMSLACLVRRHLFISMVRGCIEALKRNKEKPIVSRYPPFFNGT